MDRQQMQSPEKGQGVRCIFSEWLSSRMDHGVSALRSPHHSRARDRRKWGIKKAQSLEGARRGAGPTRSWRVRGRGLALCYVSKRDNPAYTVSLKIEELPLLKTPEPATAGLRVVAEREAGHQSSRKTRSAGAVIPPPGGPSSLDHCPPPPPLNR
jgi:hypothetical protein